MRHIIIIFISVLFLFQACQCQEIKLQQYINKENSVTLDSLSFFFNSIGVARINTQNLNNLDHLNIYNSDNSIAVSINFKERKIVFKSDTLSLYSFESDPDRPNKYMFNPKLFYPETGMIIQFEVVKINRDTIFVYTNKENNVISYFIANDKQIIFEDWTTHLMNSIIKFNPSDNPLKNLPSEAANIIPSSNNDQNNYIIREIKGEWLYIECVDFCNDCSDKKKLKGWIKWRSKKTLLIALYYTC